MRKINVAVLDTPFQFIHTLKVGVVCESCNWKGRRTLKVVTNMVGNFEDEENQFEVTKSQLANALQQSSEMRSYPECPKCNSDDVYHHPTEKEKFGA